MKRIIIGILELILIGVWMLTCFYVCRSDAGFNGFLYRIICGFPFGIGKMCMIISPRNFGIAGGLGILALNGILGGLIGGIALVFIVVKIIIRIFGTLCSKVVS